MKFKIIIKRLSLSLVCVGVAILCFLLVQYLKSENLWIFAYGSDQKAILNATWEMSPKEVERSNNVHLKETEDQSNFSLETIFQGQKLHNRSRLKFMSGGEVNLGGYVSSIGYAFFDERLFAFNLKGVWPSKDFEPTYYKILTHKFGAFIDDKEFMDYSMMNSLDFSDYLYLFSKSSVASGSRKRYWARKLKNKEHYESFVEVTYFKIQKQIKAAEEYDQKNIF